MKMCDYFKYFPLSNREQIDFDEVNNHDYQYADDDASPSTNKV